MKSNKGRTLKSAFLCMNGVVLAMTSFYFVFSLPNIQLLQTTISEAATSTKTVRQTMNFTVTPSWPTPNAELTDGYGKSVYVAIGGGLSLRKVKTNLTSDLKRKFHFMRRMLPSFCRTVEPGNYKYRFYFAYDYNDPYLSKEEFVEKFRQVFDHVVQEKCHKNVSVTLTLLKCNYTGKPAWAQNDAMLQAYLDGAEYFYRINDDTEFVTKNWLREFVKQLSLYQPTNVGVVGPTHDWGNRRILTYDFVHRTHIDLFGYYYPRVLTHWSADGWITYIYKPNRFKKLANIKVKHTHELGMRYRPDRSKGMSVKVVISRDEGRQWVTSYVKLKTEDEAVSQKYERRTTDKVIIFIMSENKDDVVFGCIRNAQLARIFFPTWLVRVFIGDNLVFYQGLSNVVTTLHRLGAEVVWLSNLTSSLNISLVTEPSFLSLVGIINSPEFHIIIRDAEFRFSEREKFAVEEWVQSNYTLHTIRDHPSHLKHTIVPNLWGVQRNRAPHLNLLLLDFLTNITRISDKKRKPKLEEMTAISTMLLAGLNNSILYHDSISKTIGPNIKLLHNVSSIANYTMVHFIGQTFDSNMLSKM